jgi:hypothetical protein
VLKRPLTRQQVIVLELVPTAALTVWMELGLRAALYRQLGHGSIIAGSLPNFMSAALVALIFGLMNANKADAGPSKPALMSVVALGSYELAQLAIPGRTFDAFDLVATVIGAGIAFALLLLAHRFRTRDAGEH